MATLKLYLDTRRGAGPYSLKISLSHRGATVYLPTPFRLFPENWDPLRQKVVLHPAKNDMNSALLLLLADTELKISRVKSIRSLSAREVKEAINHSEDSFGDRFQAYIELCSTEGNRTIYRQAWQKIVEFDPSAWSKSFEDIDLDWLERFNAYMARTDRINTRSIRLRCIRAVFNDAIDRGLTTEYPFRRFRIAHEPTRKRSLSPENLTKFFAAECEPWQGEYRDMFLLDIYLIGINAADLFRAAPSQLRDGRLEYRRAKTHRLYSIKVEPEAMAIINKYRGKSHLISPCDRYSNYKDYLHHFNDGLKSIGRTLGKQGRVVRPGMFPDMSSYWARHTWATLAARLDVPKDTISHALGHSTGQSVTDIYIDFDESKVDAANRKVIDYLNSIGVPCEKV